MRRLTTAKKAGWQLTGTDEVEVEPLHEADLLGVQPVEATLEASVVDSVDALEEARQRGNSVLVGGEGSGHLQFHSLKLRHAVGGAQVVEHVGHLLEGSTRAIESGDGVGEVSGLGVTGNDLKFGDLLLHGVVESMLEVRRLGCRKRRETKLVGTPVLKKRIGRESVGDALEHCWFKGRAVGRIWADWRRYELKGGTSEI